MFFCKLENIVHADSRLAAGHHVKMGTEFLAFGYDLVHILIGKVGLVAVRAGPAAYAVHVAGHGRIKEDQPRNIAVVFLSVLTDHLGAAEKRLIAEVEQHHLRVMRICLVDNTVDKAHPAVIGILHIRTDCRNSILVRAGAVEFFREIHDLEISLGSVILALQILQKTVNQCAHGRTFSGMLDILNSCHFIPPSKHIN